jgi:hypothetical protein
LKSQVKVLLRPRKIPHELSQLGSQAQLAFYGQYHLRGSIAAAFVSMGHLPTNGIERSSGHTGAKWRSGKRSESRRPKRRLRAFANGVSAAARVRPAKARCSPPSNACCRGLRRDALHTASLRLRTLVRRREGAATLLPRLSRGNEARNDMARGLLIVAVVYADQNGNQLTDFDGVVAE